MKPEVKRILETLGLDDPSRVGGLLRNLEGSVLMRKAAVFHAAGISQNQSEKLAGYTAKNGAIWRRSDQRANIRVARDRLISYLDAIVAGDSLNEAAKTILGGLKADKMTKMGLQADWSARHKFTDTVLKVHDAYPAQKFDIRQAKLSRLQVEILDSVQEELE